MGASMLFSIAIYTYTMVWPWINNNTEEGAGEGGA
jgi:hypothetical protein